MILANITLPEGLYWHDLDYSPVKQQRTDSLTGRVIIQRGRMLEGRPITLLGRADSCWLSRAEALALANLRDQDQAMSLSINGLNFTVRFDYSQSDHLLLRPLHEGSDSIDDDEPYTLTKLALIEVLE